MSANGQEGEDSPLPVPGPAGRRKLHKIRSIRRSLQVKRSNLANVLGASPAAVKAEEEPETDLHLSRLYQYADALNVPVTAFLITEGDPLAGELLTPASARRLVQTALALRNENKEPAIERMLDTFLEQLAELEPRVIPLIAANQRPRERHRPTRRKRPSGESASRPVSGDSESDS